MLYVQDALEDSKRKRDWAVFWSLALALSIGGITPLHEIARTVQHTVECRNTGMPYGTVVSKYDLLNSANFSGSTEGSLFFEYFAKKP